MSDRQSLLDHLRRWCWSWLKRRSGLAESQHYSPPGMERLGRDAGGNAPRVLAGRWPDSADLLTRRLANLGFGATEVSRADPQIMRDLQRVCSLCGSRRECEHELARDPTNAHWQEYCPNAVTLITLQWERSKKPTRG